MGGSENGTAMNLNEKRTPQWKSSPKNETFNA